jgi:hypothetical protein
MKRFAVQLGLVSAVLASLSACGDGALDAGLASPRPVPLDSQLPRQPLPLGLGALDERWEQCALAEGVYLSRILRGAPSREEPPLPCEIAAQFSLQGGGSGRLTLTQEPAGPLSRNGPWAVHVLEIDPTRFSGEMRAVLGQDRVVGKETPSSVGTRLGAIASLNGGYFVVGEGNDQINADGMAGDPAGLAVIDGRFLSESVNGRSVMRWTARDPATTDFPVMADALWVHADGAAPVRIDGINRVPGRIRMCGGVGDTPFDAPRHDQTCTDDDELIWFDAAWGDATPTEADLELVLDASGRPLGLRPAGGPIPESAAVLSALGPAAVARLYAWQSAAQLRLAAEFVADGAPYLPPPDWSVTNGGPLLVQDGRAIDRTREEGFVEPLPGIEPRQPLPQYLINTVYLLGYRETGQPRTLAARTRTGRLLFVLVDGRRPDWSVGLSLQDATDLLLHFEAEAGINLDGGGSAAMWANGAVVNVVSGGGERAVSDVIVLIPEAPSVP